MRADGPLSGEPFDLPVRMGFGGIGSEKLKRVQACRYRIASPGLALANKAGRNLERLARRL